MSGQSVFIFIFENKSLNVVFPRIKCPKIIFRKIIHIGAPDENKKNLCSTCTLTGQIIRGGGCHVSQLGIIYIRPRPVPPFQNDWWIVHARLKSRWLIIHTIIPLLLCWNRRLESQKLDENPLDEQPFTRLTQVWIYNDLSDSFSARPRLFPD